MSRGIKETMDIIAIITALGVLIGEEISVDGLQVTDVFMLFESDDFRNKAYEALRAVSVVPAELRDLSVNEGFELSLASISTVREILASFERST